MISGSRCFNDSPTWFLGNERVQVVDSLEILGITFDDANNHIHNRISKCRRAFDSLRDAGMAYPGCSVNVKACLWNTICQSVSLYGSDC